jgi:tetratricopeptide (TPR) repeat protein
MISDTVPARLTYFYFQRLDDFENSCAAYEKAIELGEGYLAHLNYAITLFLNDEIENARTHFKKYDDLFGKVNDVQDVDADITKNAKILRQALAEDQSNH